METYRLSSKLIENKREFVIQTANDVSNGVVQSTIFVNGVATDATRQVHPAEIVDADVLSLVKESHTRKKSELELMLKALRLVLDSGSPEALVQLGTSFFYKSFFTEAADLFNAAIMIDSTYHQAYNYLARTELLAGRVDLAGRAAKAAVEFQPRYADYHFVSGECCLAASDYSGAVTAFEKAIKINTYYGDAHYCLGLAILLNAINQHDTSLFEDIISKCKDYFTKAGIIDDQYEGDIFAEGLTYLEKTDLESAYSLFKKAFDLRQTRRHSDLSDYYLRYVYYYAEVSDETLDNRIKFLEAEISKNPDYVDLYAEVALCYLNRSKLSWEKAQENFRQALNINPQMGNISKFLATVEEQYKSLQATVDDVTRRSK